PAGRSHFGDHHRFCRTQENFRKMNKKQLLILLVLAFALGGAWLWRNSKQNASWKESNSAIGKKLLGEFPVNDVAHVSIKQGTNELNLVKKDTWRVAERKDYPANFSELSEFINKMAELKVIQTEKVGPSQLARLSLVPGSATNSAMIVDF